MHSSIPQNDDFLKKVEEIEKEYSKKIEKELEDLNLVVNSKGLKGSGARILYYVPIIHTSSEAITSRKESLEGKKARDGEEETLLCEKKIYRDWLQITKKIKEEIKKQNLDFSKLFIYQDSWLEDFEIDPVEMQKGGIPNQIILGKLIEKGAKLIVVESKKLFNRQKEVFIEEDILNLAFERVQEKEDLEFLAMILKKLRAKQKKLKTELYTLMCKRDEHIAKRIDQTLPEDGIGILFIGANHKVNEELKKFSDIKIIYLGGDEKCLVVFHQGE